MKESPTLSIIVLTFNHESYVIQALDSIFEQITEYSFEVIVGDDCSKDDTLNRVQEYYNKFPNSLRVITSEKNVGMKENAIRCIRSSKGKYIAICDGDDFWIDRFKIDRQIKFLENNLDYALIYSQARRFIQKDNAFNSLIGSQYFGFNSLSKANVIPTVTVMFRLNLYLEYIELLESENKLHLFTDYSFWLFLAKNQKLFFEEKITSVYRVLNESLTHSKSMLKYFRHANMELNIKLFFTNSKPNILIDERNKLMLKMSSRYYPKFKYLFFKRIRSKSFIDYVLLILPFHKLEFIIKRLSPIIQYVLYKN